MEKKKDKLRIAIEIIVILIAVLIVVHLTKHHAPHIIKILESGNINEIDDYLNQYGNDGKYLLIVLQIIETISIVLPAVPVYICAGVLFGKIKGILICYGVNLILNVIIFEVARKIESLTNISLNIKKQKTINKMIENAKHMDRVVLAMCLLPIVPNGMIPYLSAQTKVTVKEFMKALMIGSLPSILVYVCCGDILISDSYKIIIPIIIVLVIVSIIAFIFRKQFMKYVEPKIKNYIEG